MYNNELQLYCLLLLTMLIALLYLITIVCRRSDCKQLVVTTQFSEGYPATPLLVELKSKTLPEKLLRGMEDVCDKELKQHCGNPQVGLGQLARRELLWWLYSGSTHLPHSVMYNN